MEEIGTQENLEFIVIVVIIFFLIREVICWYYKINKQVELQTETVQLLKKLVELNTPKAQTERSTKTLSEEESNVNDPAIMNKIISKLNEK